MLREKLENFFSLGFESPPAVPHVPLMLGKKRHGPHQKLVWEISCWLLLTCGIFLRKGLVVANLSWVGGNLTWKAFAASVVVGLAAFPAYMRWFNRGRKGTSPQHYAVAFTFGFCLDLAAFAADKIVPHLRG
jgi:hypothetical protein